MVNLWVKVFYKVKVLDLDAGMPATAPQNLKEIEGVKARIRSARGQGERAKLRRQLKDLTINSFDPSAFPIEMQDTDWSCGAACVAAVSTAPSAMSSPRGRWNSSTSQGFGSPAAVAWTAASPVTRARRSP